MNTPLIRQHGINTSRPLLGWAVCLLAAVQAQSAHAACAEPMGLPRAWPQAVHAGQALVPAGQFIQGSQDGYVDERPPRQVHVDAFWMDRTEVTNAQFTAFVRATHHVTEAERQGGSAIFVVPSDADLKARPMAWWRYVKGADWRHPQGPASSLQGKAGWPVVHVTLADAQAYARWLGHDLPTETEWEYAAKAGRQGPELDVAPRDGKGHPQANYWQGNFPMLDTGEDGHKGLAPVACYDANPWGLHDMVGNVWEWTSDVQHGPVQGHANGDPSTVFAKVNASAPRMVIKGGSYLCSPDYCVRYRASAREAQDALVSTSHVGFRTITRAQRPS